MLFAKEMLDQLVQGHAKQLAADAEKRLNYGPVIDSEQYLLTYLEINWLTKYRETLEAFLQRAKNALTTITIKIDPSLLSEEDFSKHIAAAFQEQYATAVQFASELKEYNVEGVFLHIHSLLELCEFCATSLWCESYERLDNVFERIKKENSMGKNAFITITCSWEKELERSPNHDEKRGVAPSQVRPRGTASDKLITFLTDDITHAPETFAAPRALLLKKINAGEALVGMAPNGFVSTHSKQKENPK